MQATEQPPIQEGDSAAAEEPVVSEENLAEEITKDIETGAKPKKPRTEKQKAAFEEVSDPDLVIAAN